MTDYREVRVGVEVGLHEVMRVGLAHIEVSFNAIEQSYRGSPDISDRRMDRLAKLLNEIIRHGVKEPDKRVDLLVFPEVSIPHSWEAFLTRWSRQHQIGIICGLEHRVHPNDEAWNDLLSILPYRTESGHRECFPIRRLKRHYAPEERFRLEQNYLHVPDHGLSSRYHLFRWRGASFAVYNCYELASIEDRSLFKGKVDFIVCSEFNPDVSYFSNIVESASRDLHCYVVQVNSAHFGDSRVVSPSGTDKMKLNPLRIRGGDNQTFLTMKLPLQALRDHQRLDYGLQKESEDFKPTPPGFPRSEVLRRSDLGNPDP